MLEIASEIIVCLLIAATIGAAIGYLICKSLSAKTESAAVEPHTEEKAEREEKEVVRKETPEVSQGSIEETPEVSQESIEETPQVSQESTEETPEVSQESIEETPQVSQESTEETPEVSQESIEETIEDVTEEEIEIKDESKTEEVEIPTEDAIEKALEALEEIDLQDDDIPEIETESDKKPELLSSPRNGKKDALTQIKGVGPKLEEKLNTAGIYHFDQIASWTEADFEWLEANTAFASRAKKDNWVSQAKSFI